MDRRIVELIIQACSAPIFDRIFDSSDKQNDNQWYRVEPRIRCPKDWGNLRVVSDKTCGLHQLLETHVKYDDDKEVNVGNIMELIE